MLGQRSLSKRLRGPFLARLVESIHDCDAFSSDGDYDDFVRFSSFAKTISTGFQVWIMRTGDESGLDHDMAHQTSPASDGALAAQGAAIVRDWRKACECGSLLSGDLSQFRHLSDQY